MDTIPNLPISVNENDIKIEELSDYEKYAKELKSYLPDLPKVDIIIKNYSYDVKKMNRKHDNIPNIISGAYYEFVDGLGLSGKKSQVILKDISYHFKAGSSTLIFGPPSSGTTSLLKALAGYIPSKKHTGSVKCDGKSIEELNWNKLCSFCGQNDIEVGNLSVKETLEFAIHCLNGSGNLSKKGHFKLEYDVKKKYKVLIEKLGLNSCENSIIGDYTIRGISGGEKKRVSLGETLASPARILLLDKISTGLDSAVTYDICKMLNEWSKIFEGILVCHLLQPDPEVIGLFDNVIILSEGEIIYGGSSNSESILNYFNSIGFAIPENKDIGSFLSDMGKEESRLLFRKDENVKVDIKSMVELYHRSEYYERMEKEMNDECSEWKVVNNDYNDMIFNQKYAMPFFQQFCYLFKYHFKNTYRNYKAIRGRIMQQLIFGLIMGWMFFGLDKNDFISKVGGIVISLSTIVNATLGLVITSFFNKQPLYKQLKQGYYCSSAYILSSVISNYLIQFVECLIYGTLIYSMMGFSFDNGGEYYFIYILSLFLGYTTFISCYGIFIYLFETIGGLTAFLPVIGFAIYTFNGFNITRKSIPIWLIEFYYFSPIAHMTKCQLINEFTSNRYTKEESEIYLNAYDIPTERNEIWYSLIIVLCEHIFFVICQILVVHFFHYDPYYPSKTVDNDSTKKIEKMRRDVSERKSSSLDDSIKHVDFTFEHVKYTVRVKDPSTKKKVNKVLLDDVSGFVRSHSMTALMGASGAGKTTLLDVLANRKTIGKIEGKFLLNGKEYNKNDLCMISGYVEQEDTLPETETVKEALMFSGRLRYPGNPKDNVIVKYVNEIIELLGLSEYGDMMIGRKENGLAMGIRKLVMVGIELAANPSILFLDEPTTGLDSSSALLVCQILQRIAESGRSIICTIHQPSYEIFKLFSDVLLLERGGKVVYCGGLGENGSKVVEYVSEIENVAKIKEDENPASWMLEVTGAGVDDKNTIKFGEYYMKSKLYEDNLNIINEIKNCDKPSVKSKCKYSVSILKQIYEVTKRNFRMNWRKLDFNLSRIKQILIAFIPIGIVYFQLDKSNQGGLQSMFNGMTLNMISCGLNCMFPVISFVIGTRMIFYREDGMKTYHPFAHLFSLVFVEAIYALVICFIFNIIFYPMVGLDGEVKKIFTHFLITYELIFFSSLCGEWLCYFLKNESDVSVAVNAGSCIVMTFSGLFTPYDSLKAPWKWLYWVNPEMYAIQAVSINQFQCDSFEKNRELCPTVSYENNNKTTTIHEYFLKFYGMRYDLLWNYILYEFIAICVVIVLLYVSISRIRHFDR